MNHVKQQKNNNLKTKQWRKKRHRRQQWLWHIYIKSLWICDHMTSLFKTWDIQTQKTRDSIPNYCDVCWPWWKDDMLYQLQKWFLSLGSFLFYMVLHHRYGFQKQQLHQDWLINLFGSLSDDPYLMAESLVNPKFSFQGGQQLFFASAVLSAWGILILVLSPSIWQC